MLLQNLFSKTKRMQTGTSNIFLFVSEELEKNIDLREGKTRKRSKDLYKVNKNENIQAKT
jgi:hypothetical protein